MGGRDYLGMSPAQRKARPSARSAVAHSLPARSRQGGGRSVFKPPVGPAAIHKRVKTRSRAKNLLGSARELQPELQVVRANKHRSCGS
jgi:hypothetical protein